MKTSKKCFDIRLVFNTYIQLSKSLPDMQIQAKIYKGHNSQKCTRFSSAFCYKKIYTLLVQILRFDIKYVTVFLENKKRFENLESFTSTNQFY